jgi:membrane-associated phospholipid phosphatase
LRQFISNNPYRDISLITWALTVLGWWEHGVQMFWLTTINTFVAGILRALIQAPRPFEFDRRLRPFADRQISGYGFPSMESFMAVVTYGYLGLKLEHPAWQTVNAFMCLFIGITRLYAGSRFIHQIIFSWIFGSLSLWFYMENFAPLVPEWGGSLGYKNVRLALMAPWVLAFLAYVCLSAEENSSSLLGIPKIEFMHVLSGIMDVGAASVQRGDDGRPKAQEDADGPDSTKQVQHERLSTRERRQQKLKARQDSFYFLQHSMRANDIERLELLSHRGLHGDNDDDEDNSEIQSTLETSGGRLRDPTTNRRGR